MLKKTLSLLSLVYGGFAIAGTMGPVCAPGNVTVPCEANQWEFGAQALYLKHTSSATLGEPSVNTSTLSNYNTQADWNWGFLLNGAFHFGTGSDISLNWTHLDNDNDVGRFNGQYLQLITAGSTTVPAAYELSLQNRYDQVNLVIGQHVDMSERKHARFYGGIQYARMSIDGTSIYTLPNPAFITPTGGGVSRSVDSDFSGFGPTLGIDYAYDVIPGLSVTANTSGSILYGTTRYDSATVYNNGLVVTSIYGSRQTLVPAMEAKLGASYACNLSNSQLNLVGGYQVTNYFKALQSQPITGNSPFARNYALNGPYLGVKWLGNA